MLQEMIENMRYLSDTELQLLAAELVKTIDNRKERKRLAALLMSAK